MTLSLPWRLLVTTARFWRVGRVCSLVSGCGSTRPKRVIDIGHIETLRSITEDGAHIVIGAMATHDTVLGSDLVCQHALLLRAAVAEVADLQVRHRGTVGGALVHADPASDVGAAVLALEAELVIASVGGATQTVAAKDFFVDGFETAVQGGELLTQIRVPKHTRWGALREVRPVAHQWAIVAVAATVQIDGGGTIVQAKVGLTNMGSIPLRAIPVERALVGQPVADEAVRAAAASAAHGTNPRSDLNGNAEYRKHLVTVLTRRAVLMAAGA
ncbi:carbon-monoxide dehydrogenase medium subunit [Amycolatopsis cihanbeyliensis]|uniref:Carbon-monoxide dehydrogenase medium subunit n=1 Tax=Amycolatopsis cihanbeyliensis TaxID=1128664 RepID=A0A542DEW4_AMYCI|nr:carbon-monoxide dehydrogenase medium subunit [Amycolatopsis cihanbeyliensis]